MRFFHFLPAMLTAAAVSSCALPASAEVFVLTSGGRVEGEFLNPGRAPGAAFELRTEEGLRLSLSDDLVHRVIVKSDVEKEYEAERLTMGNTAEDHWEMAERCKEAGLLSQRKRHLAEVIHLEPDHKAARTALGYTLYGHTWMTQEEYLTSRGYVRHKGSWWTRQHQALDVARETREAAEIKWRQQIKTWLGQLGTGRHAAAIAGLERIREPAAGPALGDILGDSKSPRAWRLMCLDILNKLPPGAATGTCVKLALDEQDENIRDKCLDELIRLGPHVVLGAFLKELKNEKETPASRNARINRAAYCLQRFGDRDATLPLINSLVTEHYIIVNPDQAGGGLPVNFNAGGPVGQGTPGGLGGLNLGSKPKKVSVKGHNQFVLGALTSMYPGVNFHFDTEQWKNWYTQNLTTTSVDLRRDE